MILCDLPTENPELAAALERVPDAAILVRDDVVRELMEA